jgi:tRNA threonylcarbamoyladenosine biosynthesis protein TsaE
MKLYSDNEQQARLYGEQLGKAVRGGEVIEFVGDLGAGKTSFMRGLAEGLESKDSVASPTFTLSNIYRASRRPELAEGSPENLQEFIAIHHFDFYRLQEPGLISEQLKEAISDPNTIVCVEWAESVHGILPKNRITIQITTLGENEREFKFS